MPVGSQANSRSFRGSLTFGRERRDAPEAFHSAADSLAGGGVGLESAVNFAGSAFEPPSAVEPLVGEEGRERQGEGLVGFLTPDEPRRKHSGGDAHPEVHDVHPEHGVGVRWEDELVQGVCPLLVGVTVHVAVRVLVPEVREHACVRGVNGGDGLAERGRVGADLLEVGDGGSDGVGDA